jgi:hypothetical protein
VKSQGLVSPLAAVLPTVPARLGPVSLRVVLSRLAVSTAAAASMRPVAAQLETSLASSQAGLAQGPPRLEREWVSLERVRAPLEQKSVATVLAAASTPTVRARPAWEASLAAVTEPPLAAMEPLLVATERRASSATPGRRRP